jgi:hypothetical protein
MNRYHTLVISGDVEATMTHLIGKEVLLQSDNPRPSPGHFW